MASEQLQDRLEKVAGEIRKTERQLASLRAQRDGLVLSLSRQGATRRALADLANMTTERVRQVLASRS